MLILWSGDTDQEYRCCPSCVADEDEPDLNTETVITVCMCVLEGVGKRTRHTLYDSRFF